MYVNGTLDRAIFTDPWNDPSLTRIIGMIDKALKWPLFSGATMNRWVSGNLIVLGDAAHAMLPYMSQGE